MRTHNQTEVSRVKQCHMDYDQEDGCPMCITERRALDISTRLAEAEARAERLAEAARDMCREWRLHGQLTDSCRPMERVLGIHAPFCPTWGHKDCECDLALAPSPADGKGGE